MTIKLSTKTRVRVLQILAIILFTGVLFSIMIAILLYVHHRYRENHDSQFEQDFFGDGRPSHDSGRSFEELELQDVPVAPMPVHRI